jgi:pimeloyl-ACP methyl ester carboxylesterase
MNLPPRTLPLSTLTQSSGAPNLIIMLPGAYMTPEDYQQAGFFSAISQRKLPLDIATVHLDLEAISSGSALPAIQAEIIEPARQQGYRKIWLGGISLGGLLALGHAADYPGQIDGLCLLAPYPGSRLTTNAITRAGGLTAWQPTTEELNDPEFRVWQWLKQPPTELPSFVGYGTEDRFASGMQEIAACFPANARHAIPGGHDWPVWQQLWEHFLDRNLFTA